MEIYNCEFPENARKIILIATKEEYDNLVSYLVDYQKSTKSRKRIQNVCDLLTSARNKDDKVCLLNTSSASILYNCIEDYSNLKASSSKHKVHKYRQLFDEYFYIF